MNPIIYLLIQTAVILLTAPLVNGIIVKIKALTQKRKGAPILQLYYDLYKLARKTSVVSETASWIYRITPYLLFATALAAAQLVPVSTFIAPNSLPGDIILLVSILALGRFFMMLAALDTGSTFGGMGSSREAMISALIEPSLFISLLTIGLIAGSTSVLAMMGTMQVIGTPLLKPVFLLLLLAFLTIIITETSRIPVDDPSTHLELTMVHEAMVLEYSGRQLALMEYGAAIKQLVFITLLVNLLLPLDQLLSPGIASVLLSLLLYLLKIIAVAVILAVIEVNTVKFKLFSIPNLAALAFILSFLGFFQYFVLGGSYV